MGAAVVRCEGCGAPIDEAVLPARLWCCGACGFSLPMPLRARLKLVADEGSLEDDLRPVVGGDPLSFVDSRPYAQRLDETRAQLGETESFAAARATVGGVPSIVGAMEFAFLGGTMSAAVGERVAQAFELAAAERRAVVLCTTSGGARMQEGTLALFQMAKTAAAVARFREVRRPYVVVWGHPTMGGVAASFGALADVRLAEPGARIGFAGPRVIEQLLGQALPEGFQRAEFVLEHGQVDRVVPRDRLKAELARLVPLLAGGDPA